MPKPQPLEVFKHCLDLPENRMWVIPLEETVYDGSRANDKRPAYLKLFFFDDMAKNLFGRPALRDEYYLVRVPREIIDELTVAPDAHCFTTPDGDCVSADPRCMHQAEVAQLD